MEHILFSVIDHLLFLTAGLAGMVGHQAKKWARDATTTIGFKDWLCAHPKDTVSALLAYAGASLALLSSELFEVGTMASLYVSMSTGFSLDSTFNKSPSEYTQPVKATSPDSDSQEDSLLYGVDQWNETE